MSGEYSPEGQKLFYDTFKHLTTLSTGSILLMTTFLARFAVTPQWPFLVAAALLGFLVTIVAALVVMITFAEAVHKGGSAPESTATVGSATLTISLLSFVGALLCLAAFVLKNLY